MDPISQAIKSLGINLGPILENIIGDVIGAIIVAAGAATIAYFRSKRIRKVFTSIWSRFMKTTKQISQVIVTNWQFFGIAIIFDCCLWNIYFHSVIMVNWITGGIYHLNYPLG